MKKKIILSLSGLHCVNCAKTVEKALNNTKGIHSAAVNFASLKAAVEYDDSIVKTKEILDTVKKAGYKASIEA